MMKSKEQIQQEYQELTSKVGDLYFAIKGQENQLRQMKSQMAAYHDQRNAIQAAYTEAMKLATDLAPAAPADVPAAPDSHA